MEDRQEINKSEVGSAEEVFGEQDAMFQKEHPATPEGENDSMFQNEKAEIGDPVLDLGENTVTENMKDNAPDEVPDVAPEDIKYLKNEENGRVFEVTPEIIGQRHLVPCTKEGTTFKDTRVVFNGMR
jgi:hypothetical protein